MFLSSEIITPTRNFNLLYIILDSCFILFLLGLLLFKKKYITLLWSLAGGVLYFIVDFGYFYLLSHTRTITINSVEANTLTVAVLEGFYVINGMPGMETGKELFVIKLKDRK